MILVKEVDFLYFIRKTFIVRIFLFVNVSHQAENVIKSHAEAAEETQQLEQRASEAGSTALALAAEIAQLRDDIDLLKHEKSQLTETVADINNIITAKDAEFHDVLHKIKAASARFGFYAKVFFF